MIWLIYGLGSLYFGYTTKEEQAILAKYPKEIAIITVFLLTVGWPIIVPVLLLLGDENELE